MDHTNAVYQFVSPRIKFPTKPPSFCRASGALHVSHPVFFLPLPLPLSAECQEAAVNDNDAVYGHYDTTASSSSSSSFFYYLLSFNRGRQTTQWCITATNW